MTYKSIFFLFFLYSSYFPFSQTSISVSIQKQQSFGKSANESVQILYKGDILTIFNEISFNRNVVNHKINDFCIIKMDSSEYLQADYQGKHSV